jgi:hypothetical protein
MPRFRTIAALALILLVAIVSSSAQEERPGMPTSNGYKTPALSLESLFESDKTIADAMMAYARSGDSATFRQVIESAASSGDVGGELLLAEQYIPEQCTFQPDRDVPACGPDGKQAPHVVSRQNPLKIPASYEDAAKWLERASAQGSGEASEVLAQLITRMLSNGHPTTYTADDSTRLHALARSQGFDVEPIAASCYRLTPGVGALTFAGPQPQTLTVGAPPAQPFSAGELQQLEALGVRGALHFDGTTGAGDSVLLSRPEGPIVHVRIILDHDPGHEVHLPIPAHHDVIFLQHGDRFLMLPSGAATLLRFISLTPQRADMQQVSLFVQLMSGAFSGTFCARFDPADSPKPR